MTGSYTFLENLLASTTYCFIQLFGYILPVSLALIIYFLGLNLPILIIDLLWVKSKKSSDFDKKVLEQYPYLSVINYILSDKYKLNAYIEFSNRTNLFTKMRLSGDENYLGYGYERPNFTRVNYFSIHNIFYSANLSRFIDGKSTFIYTPSLIFEINDKVQFNYRKVFENMYALLENVNLNEITEEDINNRFKRKETFRKFFYDLVKDFNEYEYLYFVELLYEVCGYKPRPFSKRILNTFVYSIRKKLKRHIYESGLYSLPSAHSLLYLGEVAYKFTYKREYENYDILYLLNNTEENRKKILNEIRKEIKSILNTNFPLSSKVKPFYELLK